MGTLPLNFLSQLFNSAKSNEKGNGVTKKQSNSGKMTKQQIRSFFPKHRNIDKSTGVEYNVTYGGTTVKFTEFKLRTVKPKPKSYPNEEENGQNGSRDRDDGAKNGIEDDKTLQNGPSTDHKNNGIESNDVKTEIDNNETEKTNRKTNSEQKNCETPEAKPEPPREESKSEKSSSQPEPQTQQSSQSAETKQNLPPGFDANSSAPKENFEAQFKNAFKNTNPKNPPKRGTEAESQKEFKNNISQSLKKSLNIGEEQKLEQGND